MATESLLFFIAYALFSALISWLTEYIPRSLDPTGIGMIAVVVLFIGFIVGAFRIGASYSDKFEVQRPGTFWKIWRRPIRSLKYGLVSLILNIAFLYLTLYVNDLIFH